MKSTRLISMSAISLLAVLAMPVRPAAQESSATQKPAPTQYTVTDLGPVGPPPGQAFFVTDNGLVAFSAATHHGTEHAFLWYKGLKLDIGKPGLGGPNSVPFGVNDRFQAVGEAETTASDPNGEDFCGFKALGLPSSGTCLPFLWQNGVMHPLPTLGGSNGAANMINNQGQAAGLAETSTADPNCPAPQVLQFVPVLWEKGKIQALPTVAGDLDGLALAVNESGQAVGASGDCAAFNPVLYFSLQPLHALLWQNGNATDLGNFGGTGHGSGNLALNLNNRGQVVGSSDLPGDTVSHAFLWTEETGMQDLGTLSGDASSSAIAINDSGEIVGVSISPQFSLRAFVFRNGVMTDLNTIADSPLILMLACSINSRGEIVGFAVTKTGEPHAYLATPARGAATSENTSQGVISPMVLTEDARKLLQQQPALGRLGVRLMGPR